MLLLYPLLGLKLFCCGAKKDGVSTDKALLSIQATLVLCQPQIPSWLLPASDDGAWSVNPSKDNKVAVRVSRGLK